MTSRLTSPNPYVHYRINEPSGLWGVGGMTLTPGRAESGIERHRHGGVRRARGVVRAVGPGRHV